MRWLELAGLTASYSYSYSYNYSGGLSAKVVAKKKPLKSCGRFCLFGLMV
jgi:hypothetical protein